MRKLSYFIILFLGIWACNSQHQSSESPETSPSKQTLVEPISTDSLIQWTPARILDFVKTQDDPDKTGSMGYRTSSIISIYKDAANPKRSLKLYITDTGGSKQILGAGPWATLDYNKPNEFTRQWKNNKLYFKYNPKKLNSEVQILHQNRYIWQLKIVGLDSTEVFKALENLPLE